MTSPNLRFFMLVSLTVIYVTGAALALPVAESAGNNAYRRPDHMAQLVRRESDKGESIPTWAIPVIVIGFLALVGIVCWQLIKRSPLYRLCRLLCCLAERVAEKQQSAKESKEQSREDDT